MLSSNDIIKKLQLEKHPEGGHFKEVYRSSEELIESSLPKRFNGQRSFSTSIYYLLQEGEFSAFHKINQDETWHYYNGGSLEIHIIKSSGEYELKVLGMDLAAGELPQLTVSFGDYFAAKIAVNPKLKTNNAADYVLSGCTVAPGFSFEDFVMPKRNKLIELFPQHKTVIEQLTYS